MHFFQKNKKSLKKILTNSKKGCIIDRLTQQWPVGQAVKTSASHAENMGSIPVRVTKREHHQSWWCFLFFGDAYEGIKPTRALQIKHFIGFDLLFYISTSKVC